METLLSIFGTYTPGEAGAAPTYVVNYFVTLGIAGAIIFLGRFMVKKIAFIRKAALPSAVVAGLLFAILMCFVKVSGVIQLSFDASTTKDLAQNLFFTGVGFALSITTLKKAGGPLVLKIAIGSVLIITLQDILGIALGSAIGLHPLLALQCSSASMAGGVATASAMGPFYESLGVADATVVGVAAGTCGNIMASLIGGPVGVFLIKKFNLKSDPNDKPAISKDTIIPLSENNFMVALAGMFCIAFMAKPITWLFSLAHINMPVCISCIFGGAIVRVFCDTKGIEVPKHEINVLSNIWLQVYLALVMMTVDFTKLAPLAGQVLILMIAQAVLMVLFGIFVAFNLYGHDYGAAVMTAGNIGWATGSATNCVANEQAIMDEYGWHSIAWDLYPSWSVICDDLYNPAILSILGTLLA